ncbi:MAG: hypothetical protein R2751_12330 [Bacteroidales bacterium]
MPMKMARQLCSEAVIIRGDMDAYSKHSKLVTEIIAEKAPLFEKASIDEHYLDLTGMDRFFGCMQWTHELRQRIMKETGLPISYGLSVNKTVSKIATGEAKPNGEMEVPGGNEREFLPCPSGKFMIGQRTFHLLHGHGTIGTLGQIPMEMMESLLGKNGIVIWKRPTASITAPVEQYSERKSIGSERTFPARHRVDVNGLRDLLTSMVAELAFQLRKEESWHPLSPSDPLFQFRHHPPKRMAYTAF